MVEKLRPPTLPSTDSSLAVISCEEMNDLARRLINLGLLTTPLPHKERVSKIFERWGQQGSLTVREAKEFFHGKLTPDGEYYFNSRLGQAADHLKESIGDSSNKEVPLAAWVLNPKAGFGVLRVLAGEAGGQAQTQKTISETANWRAIVAADDTKRDTFIKHINDLEGSLSSYLNSYCQEKDISVPLKGILERAEVLLMLDAEIRAMQARAQEITVRGEKFVREQVGIRGRTLKDRMLAMELPRAVEAAKEANVAKEQEITEKTRYLFAKISGVISSGLIGICGGLIGGLVNSVSTLVREKPLAAVPISVAIVVCISQLIEAGTISTSILETIALKSGVVVLVSALAAGAGAGLAGYLWGRRNTPEKKEPVMRTAEFSRSSASRREFLELLGGLVGTAAFSPLLIRWLFSSDKPPKEEVGVKSVKNGIELIDQFGLKSKIVYLVYGRPNKAGEATWGSLSSTMTAEQSWDLIHKKAVNIAQEIGQGKENFAYLVANPVYSSGNGDIKDIYTETLLKLAVPKGVAALDFSDIQKAQAVLLDFERKFSKEILPYLSVSLDVEHFSGGGSVDAKTINEFSAWYAQKHQEWCQKAGISDTLGFVFVYTFRTEPPGCITNLPELKQYYLEEKTLVVPIFDGYGSKSLKLGGLAALYKQLPNSVENPALIGTMEFQSKWGRKYDTASIGETFSTLAGAPVYFFVSQ